MIQCLTRHRSAFLDTGAVINLIKLETYKELSAISNKYLNPLPLDLNIRGMSFLLSKFS